MDHDAYIDWELARDGLVELHREVMDGIRLCDIFLCASPYESKDFMLANLSRILTLTDEQIEEASELYKTYIASIKRLVAMLGQGEIRK